VTFLRNPPDFKDFLFSAIAIGVICITLIKELISAEIAAGVADQAGQNSFSFFRPGGAFSESHM
jgi:hypothetical protein